MEVTLKNIAKITAGNSAPNKDEFSKRGIPFIRAGSLEFLVRGVSIEECELIDPTTAKEKRMRLFAKGSILFAKSGMSAKMGRIYVLPQDAYVVSHLAVITVTSESANNQYISYYFNYRPPFNLIKDDAYPSISISDIENVEIPLPDIETQNKIVAILDKAKSILDKREKTIAKYDELLKAIFLEMFGDPVLNTKNWQIKSFREVAKNENSKRVPIKESDRDKRDGQFPYYGATGIIDFIDDYKFDGNYLLIAEDGKNLLYNRKNNAFLASGKFWVNNHAHILSDNGVCTIYYLLFFLNMIDLKLYITGIDQIKLNKNNLEKIPVPVPPKELQAKFDSIFKKYENLKIRILKSRDIIETLNNGISQLAFKGELAFNTAVDLEVLLESSYKIFKENINTKSIQLLLKRLDKDELNENQFSEQEIYDKAKDFVFELIKEGKVKQVFDKKTKRVKLTV